MNRRLSSWDSVMGIERAFTRTLRTLALASIAIGPPFAPVFAQTVDFPGGPGGGQIPGMPGSGHFNRHGTGTGSSSGGDEGRPSDLARFATRLDELHRALNLGPDQSAVWDRFDAEAEKVRGDIERPHGRAASVLEAHAPQLIEQALDGPRDAVTALEDVEAAAKNLYQALSPTQKEVADRELTGFMRFLIGAEMRAREPDAREGSR